MSGITQSENYKQMLVQLQEHIRYSPNSQDMRKFTHYLLKSPTIDITGVFSTDLKKSIQEIELQNLIVKIDDLAQKIFSRENKSHAENDVKVMSSDLHKTVEEIISSGNNYLKGIEDLYSLVRQLENPYLKRDLISGIAGLKKIVEFAQTAEESSEDINESQARELLKDIVVSSKIKESLHNLISEIVDYIRLQKDPKEIAGKITKDIWNLSHMRVKDPLEGVAFEVFCRLPQVMQLSNEDMKEIKNLIQQKDENALFEGIKQILKNRGLKVEDLNTEIQKRDEKIAEEDKRYYNLENLLLEVLEGDPVERGGITPYWDEEPKFFEGRTLEINDPSSSSQVKGVIIAAQIKDNQWTFTLDTLQEVLIDDQNTLTVTSRKESTVLESIQQGLKEFTIKSSHANLIATGQYQLKEQGKQDDLQYICLETVSDQQTHHYYELTFDDYEEEKKLETPLIHINEITESGKKEIRGHLTHPEFDFFHQVVLLSTTPFLEINQDNIDDYCKVSKEVDEDQAKLILVNNSTQKLQELRKALNPQLKEKLIDHLIKNQLDHIEDEVINELAQEHGDLKEALENISDQYREKLGIEYTPAMLLKEIVEEANYLTFTEHEESLSDLKMIEKLQQVDEKQSSLSDKNLLLFMGNSDLEKRDFINYLLGKKEMTMATAINFLSDSIYKDALPVIRHSPIDPDVFYTQSDTKLGLEEVFVDSPDFKGEHGLEKDLYANLSMSRLVQKSQSIQAVVTVVTVDDFAEDKESDLLETIKTVQRRFKDAFDVSDTSNRANHEKNKNFFLGVTHETLDNKKIAASIKDGSVIDQFLKKAENELKGEQSNDAKLQAGKEEILQRKNIWSALKKMHVDGQIHVLNPKHISAISRLLNQYTQKLKPVEKERYLFAMENENLRIPLSWHTKDLASTWTHTFLKSYHEVLPGQIKELEDQIKVKEHEIEQYEKEKSEVQNTAQQEIKSLEALKEHLSKIEKGFTSLQTSLQTAMKHRGNASVMNCRYMSFQRIQGIFNAYAQSNSVPTGFSKIGWYLITKSCGSQFHTISENIYAELKNLLTEIVARNISADFMEDEEEDIQLWIKCKDDIAKYTATALKCGELAMVLEDREEELQSKVFPEFREKVQQRMNEIQQEINRINKEREEELSKMIEKCKQDIQSVNTSKKDIERVKKNLAALLLSEWKNAALLRECSELVMAPGLLFNKDESLMKSCLAFRDYFDQHQDSILKNVKAELNFS